MKPKFRQVPTRMLLVCALVAAFPASQLTAETCISPYIKALSKPETVMYLWTQRSAVHVMVASALTALWGWGLMWFTPTFLARVYHLSPGEKLSAYGAILQSGGFSHFAKESGVYVLRAMPDGTKARLPVDVKAIKSGRRPDVLLQSNDIIVVPEKFFSF